jgi:predicted nucleic acid-binding Zn ribbon protein
MNKPVKCGCGGEAKVISYLSREYCKMAYYVRCENCGTETDDLHSEAEAIEAWNRAMGERTAKVVEDEWTEHKMLSRDYGKIYYQHDCSCNLYESPYPFCPNCGMKMKRGKHE